MSRSVLRLQLLQIAALGLPLLIHPWLARHLAPPQYGRFIFVSSLTAYLILLCDFGFNWSATRLVAVHRGDASRLADIVWSTLAARLALFAAGAAVVAFLAFFVGEFREEGWALAIACVGVLGVALSPTWYFQGTDRAHVAIILEICGRTLALVLALAYVDGEDDLLFALGAVSVGQLVCGAIGFALLSRQPGLHWRTPQPRQIAATLRSGAPLFASTSAVSLYTAASSLLLGFVGTRQDVAWFGAAQKVVGAASVLLTPLQQILFPRASVQLQRRAPEVRGLLGSALAVQACAGAALSLVLFIWAPQIVHLLFGAAYEDAILCLQWMAPAPLLIAIASVSANLMMLALGRHGLHLRMTLIAAVLHVIALLTLAPTYGAVGAAAALLATELFIAVYASTAGRMLLKDVPRASTP